METLPLAFSAHLTSLRRYAEFVTGSAVEGDAIVDRALAGMKFDGALTARDTPRNRMFQHFQDTWRDEGEPERLRADVLGDPKHRAWVLSQDDREALALNCLTTMGADDIAYVMRRDRAAVARQLEYSSQYVFARAPGRVLILEAAEGSAEELGNLAKAAGHRVTFASDDRELNAGLLNSPTVVIADAGESGSQWVRDKAELVSAQLRIPIVYVATGQRLTLDEESERTETSIRKPFSRVAVAGAINSALLFPGQRIALTEDDSNEPGDGTLHPLAVNDHESEDLAPIAVHVEHDQLRLLRVGSPAEALLPIAQIEPVRLMHLATSLRLAKELEGTNATGLHARICALSDALASQFREEEAVRFGIEVHGLAPVAVAAREILNDATFADLETFTRDLINLARTFPSYRSFVQQSRDFKLVSQEAVSSANLVIDAIVAADERFVNVEVKDSLGSIRSMASGSDPIERWALVSSVARILRAIGGYLKERAKGVRQSAETNFDKGAGKGLAGIVLGAAAYGSIKLLGQFFPHLFSYVPDLLHAARTFMP